jgi:hypothetical protein
MFFLAISMPAAASSIIVIRTLEDASDIDQIVRFVFHKRYWWWYSYRCLITTYDSKKIGGKHILLNDTPSDRK